MAHFPFVSAVTLTTVFGGCCLLVAASNPPPNSGHPAMTPPIQSVRKVDFSQCPEMQPLADHAREFCNQYYPKIVDLLSEDSSKAPRQFDIIIKRHLHLKDDGDEVPGNTGGKVVRLSASSLQKYPFFVEGVLAHEMAHVVQHYHWYSSLRNSPRYWIDGIADYIRFALGYTNGMSCMQCSTEYPH